MNNSRLFRLSRIVIAFTAASGMMICPAVTNVSLLASAIVFPLSIAAMVGRIPIMPTTAAKMASALGMESRFANATIADVDNWGEIPVGTTIHTGTPLFPRVEKKVDAPPAVGKDTKAKKTKEEAPAEGLISFDQFKEVELRVAEVVAAIIGTA